MPCIHGSYGYDIYIHIHYYISTIYTYHTSFLKILWTQGNCKVRHVNTLVGWWDQFWQSTESKDLGFGFLLFFNWSRVRMKNKDKMKPIQTLMTPNVLLMVQNSSEKTSQDFCFQWYAPLVNNEQDRLFLGVDSDAHPKSIHGREQCHFRFDWTKHKKSCCICLVMHEARSYVHL